jgi:cell division protease FtsH
MLALIALSGALLLVWLWRSGAPKPTSTELTYSEFYSLAEQGKLASVVLDGHEAECELKAKEKIDGQELKEFHALIPDRDDSLLPLLRERQVKIRVTSDEQSLGQSVLVTLLPWVLIIGVWVWISRRAQRNMLGGGGPFGSFMKSQAHKFERTADVNVTFNDVAGLKAAKRDLEEVVGFLREPERFMRLGGKVPRGILLVGPPGTGKTLLARAVAGESRVPFYSISASEFIEMFVGVGAARVRDLFGEAKKSAPSIVFIDEIDAVGRSRGAGLGGGHDEREQTLNQLLSEMDGFARNDLTIVIAATNRPDVLDPALLRPGRFDRRVIVDRPELDARRAILGVHTKKKPLGKDVDLEQVARNTPGFSGADLANLVNEAVLGATRRGVDAIEAQDFTTAYDKIVLGDPRESKLDPREKHRVAVHESGHAVVAHFVTNAEPLHRVSIIPRGMALGVTMQTPAADRHIMTQPEIESRLSVLMGGYAAERIVLGDVSSGAENDLKEATRLATRMVANYGMSSKLGPVYYEHEGEHPFLGQLVSTESGTSDATIATIESEARSVLGAALASANRLIGGHKAELTRLVEALLAQETVDRTELVVLLGSPPEKVGGTGETVST